jgi:L-ascorbate metabolism protein UlaG (beta-lactamase superfamily)
VASGKVGSTMTGSSGAPGCTLTWWGHAAVAVTLDGVRCVTDPLLRRRIGPLHYGGHRPSKAEIAGVDLVLLSHLHRDHTDLPSLSRFPARTRVVVPAGGAALVRRRIRATVEELDVDETTTVGPVTVQAVVADHDGRRRFGGPTAVALGYLLRGSRSVYAAGDTDVFPQMRDLAETPGGLDVALLPVSGWGLNLGPGHMDAVRAAEALTLLRPRLAVPVHWGTLRIPVLWRLRPERFVTPADDFASHAAIVAPDCRVVVAAPNKPLDVPERIAS